MVGVRSNTAIGSGRMSAVTFLEVLEILAEIQGGASIQNRPWLRQFSDVPTKVMTSQGFCLLRVTWTSW